jgi:GTPase
MRPEADAEVVLVSGENHTPSPISSYNFVVSFEAESFSAALVPAGSGHLKLGEPTTVRLQFNFAAAGDFLKHGAKFTFFEGGRVGRGVIL